MACEQDAAVADDTMSAVQPWSPSPMVTAAGGELGLGLAGPLPSGLATGVDGLASGGGNWSHLSDDEIHRHILLSPHLRRPGWSNFDPVTQVQCSVIIWPTSTKPCRHNQTLKLRKRAIAFAVNLF